MDLFLDFPYMLDSEWINAGNTSDVRPDIPVNQRAVFESPADSDDWILHVYAPKPKQVATGNFPDITVDNKGNIHMVYNRSGLMYRKYDTELNQWTEELAVGCTCTSVNSSDPDIVVDSKGNPHVYCGDEYAWFDGEKWEKLKTRPVEEPVSTDRAESPHIVAGKNGKVYIASVKGYVFERNPDGQWKEHGRKVNICERMQPELGIDFYDNLYLTAFGGRFNTRYKGYWTGERVIDPASGKNLVGFVETAGYKDFAYVVWEEGMGNADEGLHENAAIFVGILYPDGRLVGF